VPTELPDAVVGSEIERAEQTPVLPHVHNPAPDTAVAENVPQPQEKRTRGGALCAHYPAMRRNTVLNYHCIELS